MAIAEVNIDEPDAYVGDSDDGWYLGWDKNDSGWYFSAVVDCDTSGFIDGCVTDDGPYPTELDVAIAAIGAAMDWCCENEVETDDFIHCLPERLRAQYEALTKEDEHETSNRRQGLQHGNRNENRDR
jgi:hypothetical protein